MKERKNIILNVMLSVYIAMFIIFILAIFFGGQKIGGALYFVNFCICVVFALLDRKYELSNKNFFPIFLLISDLVNIVAVSTMIYYNIIPVYFIASLVIMSLCFVVDIFARVPKKGRNVAYNLALVFNCMFMLGVFPYFFALQNEYSVALIATVFGGAVLITKIVLLFLSNRKKSEAVETSQELLTQEENLVE